MKNSRFAIANMLRHTDAKLTPLQLSIILHNDNTFSEDLETMRCGDLQITYGWLCSKRITVSSLEAAGLGPLFLYQCGARTAADLASFGYNSLHLAASPSVCSEAVVAFGHHAVRAAFLKNAQDAVNVAGTSAQACLGLQPKDLVALCDKSPEMAMAVFVQLPKERAFVGLEVQNLQLCGVTSTHLIENGFRSSSLLLQMKIRAPELCRLGFSHPPLFFTA